MRRLLSIIVSLVTAISFAQQPVELPLWPDGAPNSSGLTGEEQETRPHFVTNVTHPTLTVYHPEKPNGMAIIMCPGGGYRGLGMDGEGYDMAPWFCGQGITYMVLKYRMPNGHWEVPVSDAEQAIRRNEPDDPTGPVNCARVSAWCSKATICSRIKRCSATSPWRRCSCRNAISPRWRLKRSGCLAAWDLPIARTLGRTNCPAVSASVWPFAVR